MAATIISRPDDFSSAYVPVEYTFSSNFAGQTADAWYMRDDGNGKLEIRAGFAFIEKLIKPDGIITLSNGDAGTYDGEHIVRSVSSPSFIVTDTDYISDDNGGDAHYTRLNTHMLCDLYIDGSFVVRKKRFPDINDQFVFDFKREIQVELGNDMKPMALGLTAPSTNAEGSVSIYVDYADARDIITDGVAVTTLRLTTDGDFYSDSANPRAIVNATVPYLEWELGSIRGGIINKDTDLSSFIVTSSSSARFLTNSPKSITVGSSDAYELSAIIDYDAAITEAIEIEFFDSAGTTLSTVYSVFDPATDSVWRFSLGTRGVIDAVKPANAVSYDVTIIDRANADAKISETITFNIDSNCYGTSTRFVWLNPRGGYDAYTFHSPRKLNSQVKKSSYKPARVYPTVVGNSEENITNVDASDSITTSTNKVTKEVAEWLQELLESPQVFIELDDSNALHDKRVPVVIVNKTRAIANSYSGAFNIALRYRFAFEKVGIRAN